MAYKTEELEKQSLEAIEQYNLFFINDLMAYLPCSKSTFYDLGLEKSDSILKALEANRIKTKNGLRTKWYKSQNAAVQIALMKLIAEDDERKKMSQSYTDVTSDGEKIKGASIVFDDNIKTNDQSSEVS